MDHVPQTPQHLTALHGQKLMDTITAYVGKNDMVLRGLTARMMAGIQGGFYADRHVRDFEKSVHALPEQLPLNLGLQFERTPKPVKAGGQLSALFGFMSAGEDDNGQIDCGALAPCFVQHVLTRDSYRTTWSALPVRIAAQHTAFRFIQRSCSILDIKGLEFKSMLVMATLIAQAYRDDLADADARPRGVLVPHAHGVFLGHVEGTEPEMFRRISGAVVRKKNTLIRQKGKGDVLDQPFLPKAVISLKTFYDDTMCRDDLLALRDAMVATMSDEIPGRQDAINYAYNSHVMGMMPSEGINDKVNAMLDDIRRVMRSPLWRGMEERAWRNGHVPAQSRYFDDKPAEDTSLKIA